MVLLVFDGNGSDCLGSAACFSLFGRWLFLTIDLSPTHKPVAAQTRALTGASPPTNQKHALLALHPVSLTLAGGTDTGQDKPDETHSQTEKVGT